jgi:hypothetical protein
MPRDFKGRSPLRSHMETQNRSKLNCSNDLRQHPLLANTITAGRKGRPVASFQSAFDEVVRHQRSVISHRVISTDALVTPDNLTCVRKPPADPLKFSGIVCCPGVLIDTFFRPD